MGVTNLTMYWMAVLGPLHSFISLGLLLSISLLLVMLSVMSTTRSLTNSELDKLARVGSAVFLVCISLALAKVFIPTQNQLAAMIIVPKVVNHDVVSTREDTDALAVGELVRLSNEWISDLAKKCDSEKTSKKNH